ncbi:hypothetical protein DL98DRAFT_1079 [Cadophora sp. DSE1049]|nr:hypothetical protein DL98DRAFT_1079 [Cadophora sp. DSE1049]
MFQFHCSCSVRCRHPVECSETEVSTFLSCTQRDDTYRRSSTIGSPSLTNSSDGVWDQFPSRRKQKLYLHGAHSNSKALHPALSLQPSSNFQFATSSSSSSQNQHLNQSLLPTSQSIDLSKHCNATLNSRINRPPSLPVQTTSSTKQIIDLSLSRSHHHLEWMDNTLFHVMNAFILLGKTCRQVQMKCITSRHPLSPPPTTNDITSEKSTSS